MKILKSNTETILYEKAKSLRSERLDIWRCIHIEASDTADSTRTTPNHAHFTGRITSDLLSNEDGYIYLCDDGDIFILFKGALTPILRKLSVYFEDFRPDRVMSAQHITVFDLGQNWDPFFDLCKTRAFNAANSDIPARPAPAAHA